MHSRKRRPLVVIDTKYQRLCLAGLLLVGDDLLVAHSGHDRHALSRANTSGRAGERRERDRVILTRDKKER